MVSAHCVFLWCPSDPIPAGLMEEPCDWNVIVQPPSKNDLALSVGSSVEKKQPKSEQTVSKPPKEPHRALFTKERRSPTRIQKSNNDRNRGKTSASAPDHLPSAENLEPRPALTRKEMQEALPKIPPLPSFKPQAVRPVSFAEAMADFENFMTAGPGRSVEIIRQYGENQEVITLADGLPDINVDSNAGTDGICIKSYSRREEQVLMDGIAPTVQQHSVGSTSYPVTSRCMSGSSSSSLDSESEMETEQKTDASASSSLSSAPQLNCGPQDFTKSAHAASTAKQPIKVRPSPSNPQIKTRHANNHAQALQRCKSRSVSEEKRAGKTAKVNEGSSRTQRRTQEEEEGDNMQEDSESSDEGNAYEQDYWRACYRAWEEYYNSSSSAYYYHSHYNWLAAYRMNAVYMMEMMKH